MQVSWMLFNLIIFFLAILQIQHETGINFTFTHVFNDPLETVYFAFTYPWSYTDNQVTI